MRHRIYSDSTLPFKFTYVLWLLTNSFTQGSHSIYLWKLCQRPIELIRFLEKQEVGTLGSRSRVGTIDFWYFSYSRRTNGVPKSLFLLLNSKYKQKTSKILIFTIRKIDKNIKSCMKWVPVRARDDLNSAFCTVVCTDHESDLTFS